MRILGIIPARADSKRIPGKNTMILEGKPVIEYTIDAAKESTLLDACIISTDSPETMRLCKDLGADVPFLRPSQFATDHSTDLEYVTHALNWLREHRSQEPEIIVLLPPDVPTRTAEDIDRAVQFLLDNDFDSVRTLIEPLVSIPYKAIWKVSGNEKEEITPLFPELVGKPMQTLPPYRQSIGVAYVLRTRCIDEGSLWGKRVGGLLLSDTHVELDDPEHIGHAAAALQARQHATTSLSELS